MFRCCLHGLHCQTFGACAPPTSARQGGCMMLCRCAACHSAGDSEALTIRSSKKCADTPKVCEACTSWDFYRPQFAKHPTAAPGRAFSAVTRCGIMWYRSRRCWMARPFNSGSCCSRALARSELVRGKGHHGGTRTWSAGGSEPQPSAQFAQFARLYAPFEF